MQVGQAREPPRLPPHSRGSDEDEADAQNRTETRERKVGRCVGLLPLIWDHGACLGQTAFEGGARRADRRAGKAPLRTRSPSPFRPTFQTPRRKGESGSVPKGKSPFDATLRFVPLQHVFGALVGDRHVGRYDPSGFALGFRDPARLPGRGRCLAPARPASFVASARGRPRPVWRLLASTWSVTSRKAGTLFLASAQAASASASQAKGCCSRARTRLAHVC
jgi:hypothetical protein